MPAERSRVALAKAEPERGTDREYASERSRAADLQRGGGAVNGTGLDRHPTNGLRDSRPSGDARSSDERLRDGRGGASASGKLPAKRSAEVRDPGRNPGGERQPEKRSGWGSYIRDRLRDSSGGGDGAASNVADRAEPGSSDRRSSGGGSSRRGSNGGQAGASTQPESAEGQPADGRWAMAGGAAGQDGGAGSKSCGSDAYTVQEWWYTDPKVGTLADASYHASYPGCIGSGGLSV